jgi:hypothetical protein
MKIRQIQDGDYENILAKWWGEWGFESAPPKEMLPDTGFIAFDEDVPVCSCMVYMTNSKIAWITWVLSNREYRKKPNRRLILKDMLEEACQSAKRAGYNAVFTVTNNAHAIRNFKDAGFITSSTNAHELVKLWD